MDQSGNLFDEYIHTKRLVFTHLHEINVYVRQQKTKLTVKCFSIGGVTYMSATSSKSPKTTYN